MLSPGSYIGNYRVLSHLASDRFSQVYLVEHADTTDNQRSQAAVTIRIWHALSFQSLQDYQAFQQEAHKLLLLRHAHILPVVDFGMMGAAPYIATAYVNGAQGTLGDRIRLSLPMPLPLREASSITTQVGQALFAAHQQGILHRQLTPEHIIFNAQGEPLVTDFGLATILNTPGNPLTASVYNAPELQGGALNYSKLSDQYALASIAYEMLTGSSPAHPPLSPILLNPALSAPTTSALLKALTPHPIQRYITIQAFLNALDPTEITIHGVDTTSEETIIRGTGPDTTSEETTIHDPQTAIQNPVGTAIQDPEKTAIQNPVGTAIHGVQPGTTFVGTTIHDPEKTAIPGISQERLENASAVTLAADATRAGQQSGVIQPMRNAFPTQLPGPQLPFPVRPARKRDRRRLLLLALAVLLLLALPLSGVFAYSHLPATAAAVTLTPLVRHITNTYTLYTVPGKPDATQNEVAAHVLSYTTATQSKTVQATGKSHQDATTAQGQLTITGITGTETIHGANLTSNSGVKIYILTDISLAPGKTITLPAQAANPGAAGNIPAYDVNGTFYDTKNTGVTFSVRNTAAFSGGQDSGDFTFVQQSDIDNAASSFTQQLTTSAQTATMKQLASNELLIGTLQCTPKITANHQPNDHADNLTVSVAVQCLGQAYDPRRLQALATELLTQDTASKLGPHYALKGSVVVGDPQLVVPNPQNTSVFRVKADGEWMYQFDATQEQQLAQLIKGEIQADALSRLQKWNGVAKAAIDLSGLGGSLPADAQAIKFVVRDT